MNLLKNHKKEYGITLIALIITIIILLILAGTTLNIIFNRDIINETNYAQEITNYKQAYEDIALIVMEAQIEKERECNINRYRRIFTKRFQI